PLAWEDLTLCGGDFSAYEVSILDAQVNDPELRQQLLTCYLCKGVRSLEQFDLLYCPFCGEADGKCAECGKGCTVHVSGKTSCGCNGKLKETEPSLRKIHGIFATKIYPGDSYDDVIATKGDPVLDKYDKGKRGVFSQVYGGNYKTLMERLGISEEDAMQAETGWKNDFAEIGRNEQRLIEQHAAIRQPD